MLKSENPLMEETLANNLAKTENNIYYIEEVLIPAVKAGNWDDLFTKTIIQFDNGRKVQFSQNSWNMSSLQSDCKSLYFSRELSKNTRNSGNVKILERNICCQVKCVAIVLLYVTPAKYKLQSIRLTVESLIRLAFVMLENGLNDFSSLTMDHLRSQNFKHIVNKKTVRSAINLMSTLAEYLPFDLQLFQLTSKNLKFDQQHPQQHIVIPPRIFRASIDKYSAEINSLVNDTEELSIAVEQALNGYDLRQKKHRLILRMGTKPIEHLLTKASQKRAEHLFAEHGMTIVDYYEEENDEEGKWDALADTANFAFLIDDRSNEISLSVSGKSFNELHQFLKYISRIDAICKYLCLALTGMRIDELNMIHFDYAAQTLEIDGHLIDVITTRQGKIKIGLQTTEDIFVTTGTAHNAIKILRAIHEPMLANIRLSERLSPFASILGSHNYTSTPKDNWASVLRININKIFNNELDMKLNYQDMEYIRISNPTQGSHKLGDIFRWKPHQNRRSLAYYLIGFELLAFPMLKTQLSHLSLAMTRYYARNANRFTRLQNEINTERFTQKSELLASVYQKIANNERIAGGKGKALFQLKASSTNYYEKSENNRMLEAGYWKELLKNNKTHIHAIAPGMYCTNTKCSMRLSIDLTESVDCEYSILLDGMFAEGKRINASKNLFALYEMKQLSNSVASQLIVQIRASERILRDLKIQFEPIVIPKNVSSLIISTSKAGT